MDLLSKLTEVIDEADHDGFDNYVATTKHPGNALFAIALCTSVSSIFAMPLIVKLGRHLLRMTQTTKEQTKKAGKIIINQKSHQLDGMDRSMTQAPLLSIYGKLLHLMMKQVASSSWQSLLFAQQILNMQQI